MAAVANNPAFAKKAGIPQRVGADFLKADKGRKFAKGGDMAKKFPPFMGKKSKAEEAKEMKVKAKSFALYKKGEKAEGVHGKSGKEKPTKYAAGGGCELKGTTKAQRFAGGGMPMMAPPPTAPARPMMVPPPTAPAAMTPGKTLGGMGQTNAPAGAVKPVMGPSVSGGKDPYAAGLAAPSKLPSAVPARSMMAEPTKYASPAPTVGLGSANPNSGMKAPFAPIPLSSINSGTPGSRGSSGGSFGRARARLSKFNPSVPTQQPGFNDRQVSPPESGPARKAFFDQLESSQPKMGQGSGMPLDTAYRGDNPALTGKFRQQQMLEKQRMLDMMGNFDQSKYDQRKQIADKAGRSFGGRDMPQPSSTPQMTLAQMAKMVQQRPQSNYQESPPQGMKKGGSVKTFAKGGSIDGCAQRGKTKGRMF
jgi:hypothetical protein